jgi:hypothetical protein
MVSLAMNAKAVVSRLLAFCQLAERYFWPNGDSVDFGWVYVL